MRLVTFSHDNHQPRLGALLPDGAILDLAAAAGDPPAFGSMQALIDSGPEAWAAARALELAVDASAVLGADGCRLLAPLPRPVQLRDFMCFEKHAIQAFAAAFRLRASRAASAAEREALLAQAAAYRPPAVWYERPVYYKANRFATSGPDDEILWPAYSRLMDYECELACIIGRGGVDIEPRSCQRTHLWLHHLQ